LIISLTEPRERQITTEDLYELSCDGKANPKPDGPWYKDFASFKICGEGKYPKTFLLRGQPAKGKEISRSELRLSALYKTKFLPI